MLDELLITGRRTAYMSCAAVADARGTQDRIHGDLKCAKQNERRAIAYWWAADVMNRTQVGDEDCCDQCVTDAFALAVIAKYDPTCVVCCCGDVPITCDIDATYTVYWAVDASYQSLADASLYYLIATNLNSLATSWGTNTGSIVQGTTFLVPNPGEIIYSAQDEEYYVRNDQGDTTPLFPRLDASITGTTLTVTSPYPDTSAYLGRNIVIEISSDATAWTAAYSGTEAVLATPMDLTAPADTLYIRTTYYGPIGSDPQCDYGPFMGLVTPDSAPPQPVRSFQFDPGATIAPVGSQTLDFNFAAEPTWTLAFWLKSDLATSNFLNSPFNALGVTSTMSLGSPTIPSDEFTIAWNDGNGGIGNYSNLTINTVLSDGNWHHVAFVRSTGDNAIAPTMYVDGVIVPLIVNQSDPISIGNTEPMGIYLGDISTFNPASFHLGQLYACTQPLVQPQIISTIIPNLMAGNDSGFGRLFWYQPTLTDNLTVSPFVDGGAAGAPQLQTSSGVVTFDTVDLPPIP